MQTLALEQQQDFGAGAFQGLARHLIPRNGVYEALNALLDDSGSIYKRGGSALLSSADAATNGLPLFLFDGYLSAGRRTVWADSSAYGVLDGSEAPLNLGGGGVSGPRRGVVIGGVLVVDGKAYAGSRKTANYTTGTISVTQGSPVITGSGTTWNTLVDAGMLLQIGSGRFYVVKSVDSTTQITLTEAYEGATAGGNAYTLTPLGTLPAALSSRFYAVADNKLIVGSGNVLTFSNGVSPGNAGMPPAGQLRWQTFTPSDKWEVPDGVQLLGMAALRDEVLVFTTGGLYVLGNVGFDLTDAAGNLQQTLRRVTPDLILWGDAGIASWGNALIVPATDGVWLVDGAGQPRLLSRSVPARVRNHVSLANQPGLAAVYRGHYLMPVLSAANAWADFMVCRADRPINVRGEGDVYPWTWLSGAGAKTGALAIRRVTAARPQLLGAAAGGSGSRVLNLSSYFEPAAPFKNDHDGTTHEWLVTMRDIVPDRLNIEAFVRQLRVRYEMLDAGADNPTISAWYSRGVLVVGTLWGTAIWGTDTWADTDTDYVQLSGQAPEDDGRKPYPWTVRKRARFIRFRLRSTSPVARLTLRNVEIKARPSGRE